MKIKYTLVNENSLEVVQTITDFQAEKCKDMIEHMKIDYGCRDRKCGTCPLGDADCSETYSQEIILEAVCHAVQEFESVQVEVV